MSEILDDLNTYRKENTILVNGKEMNEQILNKETGRKGGKMNDGALEYKDAGYDDNLDRANSVLNGRKKTGRFYKKGEEPPPEADDEDAPEHVQKWKEDHSNILNTIKRQDQRAARIAQIKKNRIAAFRAEAQRRIKNGTRAKVLAARANRQSQQILPS